MEELLELLGLESNKEFVLPYNKYEERLKVEKDKLRLEWLTDSECSDYNLYAMFKY